MAYCLTLADALAAAESLDPAATQTLSKFTALWRRATPQVSLDLARAAHITVTPTADSDDDASEALLLARSLETLLTSARCLLSMGSSGADSEATALDLLRDYQKLVDTLREDGASEAFLLSNGGTSAVTPDAAIVSASHWTDTKPLPDGYEDPEYVEPRAYEDGDEP